MNGRRFAILLAALAGVAGLIVASNLILARKLDWQRETIIPWINALNDKLELPK